MSSDFGRIVNINDLREAARKRLPQIVYDYLEGGAEDELTICENRACFDSWKFKPRRLMDLSDVNTSVSYFSRDYTAPIAVAPTGMNSLFWPNGDVKLAKVARDIGIPFSLSTASNNTIEEIAEATGNFIFQLYVIEK